MPPAQTKTIYTRDEKAIASKISNDLLSKKKVLPEDCPWIDLGQLYVSTTITGEGSWLPLVRRLADQGHTKFRVFTGRHGDIPNVVHKDTKQTVNVFAEEHTEEDTAVCKAAKNAKDLKDKGVKIELVDTSKHAANQTQWLKTDSLKYLKDGEVVIYAWCYSLFTMHETVLALGQKPDKQLKCSVDAFKDELESVQAKAIAKPIATLAKEGFGWVPTK